MDFTIKDLGKRTVTSPLLEKYTVLDTPFIDDDVRVLYKTVIHGRDPGTVDPSQSFEKAGPREKIFFDPREVRAAIVTCGGLCPGINDVIRSIVMEAYYRYGARSIMGIRYGYRGLDPKNGYTPIELTPYSVEDIHLLGGTILGSSRGGTEDIGVFVDTLSRLKVNILFTIGGDGTLRGARAIDMEAQRRGLRLSVVGVPKTIDNDISYIERSFGFETAFSRAVEAIYAAHVESKGAPNGIGLVKLMGRHSGFIAAHACLAMSDVNYVLLPEVPFDLDGKNGLLGHLKERILNRSHAVICVAEGAGQNLLESDTTSRAHDASGNVVLADIGTFLEREIEAFFTKGGNRDQPEVYRSELHDQERPRGTERLHPLLPARAERGACGDGGQNLHDHRPLERHVHPCADRVGRIEKKDPGPDLAVLAHGDEFHRTAGLDEKHRRYMTRRGHALQERDR